jgi:hypothetical protein
VVAGPAVNKNPRRQFSISRIGIFATAVVLGLSSRMPWAIVTHDGSVYRSDLFDIMSHGWRKGSAILFVVLAGFCAIQALASPFSRIRLFASLTGIVSLGPVLIGITQIHTFDPNSLPNPSVAIGYGTYVAIGACAVLVMSWAVFPSRMRRATPVATDPLGGYGVVNDFPGAGDTGGFGTDRGMTGVGAAGPSGAPGGAVPPAVARYTRPEAGTPPAQPGGKTHFVGLPSLGEALAELTQYGAEAPAASTAPNATGAVSWTPPDHVLSSVAQGPAGAAYDPTPSVPNPATTPPRPPVAPPAPAAHPAGWYADYADRANLRYWDGQQWTEHVRPVADR